MAVVYQRCIITDQCHSNLLPLRHSTPSQSLFFFFRFASQSKHSCNHYQALRHAQLQFHASCFLTNAEPCCSPHVPNKLNTHSSKCFLVKYNDIFAVSLASEIFLLHLLSVLNLPFLNLELDAIIVHHLYQLLGQFGIS